MARRGKGNVHARELFMFAGGYSLIEVLIALLVLTVGALGAGAIVLRAQRAGQQSARLSAAVYLAASLADSMRANPAAIALDDAANPYLQLDYDALADGPPAGDGVDCGVTSCDGAALASADLAAARLALYRQFPLGRIRVCRDSDWWDAPVAAMRWDCNGAGNGPLVVKIGWRPQWSTGDAGSAGGAAAGNAPLMVALPVVMAPLAGTTP